MVNTNSSKNEQSPLAGWGHGLLGVIIFSGSLPATRLAVQDLDPFFLTFSRASIAGVLASLLLLGFKEKRVNSSQIGSLLFVALGVVIGFPLLTAIALQYVTSVHSIVFLGLLPLSTAIFGVIRGGERPQPKFWIFSVVGSVIVGGYALSQNASVSVVGDMLMLAAILACGLGYAEGAKLSRELGGWQVISWALIISLPIMLIATFITMPVSLSSVRFSVWVALFYVSFFSMLIGFIFWYKGLAVGGIAAVSQLQLLQPFIGLGLAVLFLHETVNWILLLVTLGAVLCVAGAKKYAS
ncbi:DMT family transporter [uncultured Tolumonas sp.]|uniref:DMT family transporter n=1 Tax=uncultured Tolumonas sp. TaxID=263765 RepID=UPI00292D0DEA|nr:DMT family transporter [uncultured Tolumonas sp.]